MRLRIGLVGVFVGLVGALFFASGTSAACAAANTQLCNPTVGLSPNMAAPGAQVTASARGFIPDRAIKIVFRAPGDPIVATGTTDASGRATLTFTVPQVLAGQYDLLVTNVPECECHLVVTFIVLVGQRPTETPTPTSTPTRVPTQPPSTPTTPPPTPTSPPPATPTATPTQVVRPPVTGSSSGGPGMNTTLILLGLVVLSGGLAVAGMSRRS